MAYSHIRSITPFAGTSSVDKWATILATNPPYIPIYPTGVAATDTAAAIAALALASSSLKPIEVMPNGNVLRLNQGMSVGSNVRWIGNGVTHEVQNQSGGFNSTNRNNKFNTNGDTTLLFQLGTGLNGGGVERVEFADIVFTASSANERIVQLIGAVDGFDTSQLRISDILIRDMPCQGGGGFIAVSSLGDGSAYIQNIKALNSNIAGTTWTGTPQLTLVEIDSDIVGGTASKPGTIKSISVRDFRLTSAALTAYGAQSDCVTLAGVLLTAKCGAWAVDDVFGYLVGEVVDSFANGARISNVRGESFYYGVVSLKQGARFNVISNVSGKAPLGDGTATGSLITFQGTDAASSGDCMENIVQGFTCEAGWNTASSPAIGFLKNGGSVGLPKRNLVIGGRVVGDANMSEIVRDNLDSDQNCGNRVVMVDGTAWASKFANVAYPDNTRVSGFQPTMVRIELGANQTIATATNTTVDFSSVQEDLEGIAVAASDKVTVVRPGRYLVVASCRWTDLNGDEEVIVRVMQNTTTRATTTYTQSVSGDTPGVSVTGIIDVQEDDIGTAAADISCQVRQETGGNRTIGAGAGLTQLVITRID